MSWFELVPRRIDRKLMTRESTEEAQAMLAHAQVMSELAFIQGRSGAGKSWAAPGHCKMVISFWHVWMTASKGADIPVLATRIFREPPVPMALLPASIPRAQTFRAAMASCATASGFGLSRRACAKRAMSNRKTAKGNIRHPEDTAIGVTARPDRLHGEAVEAPPCRGVRGSFCKPPTGHFSIADNLGDVQ